MNPVVIYTPAFTEGSGGIMVLWRLAKELEAAGIETYCAVREGSYGLTYLPSGARCGLPLGIERNFTAIYPEIYPNNPLGARHIVRWILGDVPNPWQAEPHGEWIAHNPLFNQFGLPECTLLDFPPSLIEKCAYKPGPRLVSCFTRRKSIRPADYAPDYTIGTDVEIFGGESLDHVISIFKRSLFFFSEDGKTGLLTLAALCGCVPVIQSNDLKYRTLLTSQKYGVACGIGDLEHATETIYDVPELVRYIDGEHNKQQLQNMIQAIERAQR